MKNIKITAMVIMVALTTFAALITAGPTSMLSFAATPGEQMQKLAEESHKSEPACARFSRDAQALLAQKNPSAKKISALVQLYPGTPEATRKAHQLLRNTPNPQNNFDGKTVGSLYPCVVVDYFALSKKLIEKLPDLAKDEREKSVNALVSKAKREFSAPGTMLNTLVQATIISKLSESGAAPKLTARHLEIRDALKNTEITRKNLQEQTDKMLEKDYLQAWAKENIMAKNISNTWLSILSETSSP